MTMYAPAGPHVTGKPSATPMPICAFAVARRSRPGRNVWDTLVELSGAPASDPPAAPWIAVQLLPTLSMYCDAAQWLGDFERCVAWAWLTRKADLREV